MNKKESVVREDVELYFDEKYDAIQDAHEIKYGYKTYDHKILTNFHKTEVSVNILYLKHDLLCLGS